MRIAAVVLAIAAGFGACKLLDDDPPANTCTHDSDCYRAQGEVCRQPGVDAGTGMCVPGDAGP